MVKSELTIGAIIQARLGSERLPGKALLPLPFGGGPTILEHAVARAQNAGSISKVIVATTDKALDNTLYSFCQQKNIACFRGDAEDVLNRFCRTASAYGLDIIVRLTGDNPCVFSDVIDHAVAAHIAAGADYTRTEGLPLGTNIEVVSSGALAQANAAATATADREHVTPYLYNTGRNLFKHQRINIGTAFSTPLRLTVDYPLDYILLSAIFERLYNKERTFGIDDLHALYVSFPWLFSLNSTNQQRKIFSSESAELEEAVSLLQQAGMVRAAQIVKTKADI